MERILILLIALLLTACGGSSVDAPWLAPSGNLGSVDSTGDSPRMSDPIVSLDPPESEAEPSLPDSVSSCELSTIPYFDTAAEGLDILEAFCGTSQAYADGVRLVNAALGWDVKALYGMMAATSAYFGHDVDLSVASQIQAEAEAIWKSDLELPARVRENRASDQDRYIVAALLSFDFVLLMDGDDRDIQRHFSLWEVTEYGTQTDLAEAMLVLMEFIRYGNMWTIAHRLDRDPQLNAQLTRFSRVL